MSFTESHRHQTPSGKAHIYSNTYRAMERYLEARRERDACAKRIQAVHPFFADAYAEFGRAALIKAEAEAVVAELAFIEALVDHYDGPQNVPGVIEMMGGGAIVIDLANPQGVSLRFVSARSYADFFRIEYPMPQAA